MPNKNKLKNILENNEDRYLYLYFIGRLTYQKNIALLISKFIFFAIFTKKEDIQ